jgi:cell division protein FtsI/penicillin-binding protein 2
VGYAPADAPEIAFSVIVEGGGHGSDVAVPIAKKLLQTYWHVEGAT